MSKQALRSPEIITSFSELMKLRKTFFLPSTSGVTFWLSAKSARLTQRLLASSELIFQVSASNSRFPEKRFLKMGEFWKIVAFSWFHTPSEYHMLLHSPMLYPNAAFGLI